MEAGVEDDSLLERALAPRVLVCALARSAVLAWNWGWWREARDAMGWERDMLCHVQMDEGGIDTGVCAAGHDGLR